MSGQCSLWAVTRRALQGAAEYLRNPVMTDGASVEIGEGGIARGVILEGQEPEPKGYWGGAEDGRHDDLRDVSGHL